MPSRAILLDFIVLTWLSNWYKVTKTEDFGKLKGNKYFLKSNLDIRNQTICIFLLSSVL